MENDPILRAVAAIEKHLMATTPNGVLYSRYSNYDFLPDSLLGINRVEDLRRFLSLYSQMDDFRDKDQSFDTSDYETLTFLATLYLGCELGEKAQQMLSQWHEIGKGLDLDKAIPAIEARKKDADEAMAFIDSTAKIYTALQKISLNSHYVDKDNEAADRDQKENSDIGNALKFVNEHKNPELVDAQIEVLEKIGTVAETYHSVVQKIRNSPDKGASLESYMGWRIPHSMGHCNLPDTFEEYMRDVDCYRLQDLLIELSPAGKYNSAMSLEAWGLAFSGDTEKAKELWNEHAVEDANIHGGTNNLPYYQPKGHQPDQAFSISLANAKDAVLEKIAYKQDLIENLSKCIDELDNGKFASQAQQSRKDGSALSRGSEKTEPKPRTGGWADNS